MIWMHMWQELKVIKLKEADGSDTCFVLTLNRSESALPETVLNAPTPVSFSFHVLADHTVTVARSVIGNWQRTVLSSVRLSLCRFVCPSAVTQCIVPKRYIIHQKCLFGWIGSDHLEARFFNFHLRIPTWSSNPKPPKFQRVILIDCSNDLDYDQTVLLLLLNENHADKSPSDYTIRRRHETVRSAISGTAGLLVFVLTCVSVAYLCTYM